MFRAYPQQSGDFDSGNSDLQAVFNSAGMLRQLLFQVQGPDRGRKARFWLLRANERAALRHEIAIA